MQAGRELALNVLKRQVRTAIFIVAGFLSAVLVLSAPKAEAAQTVPYKVNFQGRLTNGSGNAMADGSYNMKFRLYSVLSGGSPVWTETRETTNRVAVTNGLFSVQLGDVTALSPSVFTNQPLYFEIELPTTATATCSTASCANFNGTEIMTPRRPLGASPYAMNADTLDGIDATSFARQDTSNTFSAALLVQLGSATAFRVQNASNNEVLTVDTSANKVLLGKTSTLAGTLAFANSSNANLVTITAGTTGGSGYTLTLPTALGSTNDCLKDTGSGALGFASCAPSTGGAGYIQNQNSGTQTTSNYWISGTGRADTSLLTPAIDATTASGTITLGNSNASTISVGTNAAAHTISIGSTTSGSTVAINTATSFAVGGVAGTTYTIGDTNTTGTTTIGQSTDTNSIDIGNAATAAGKTQTVNIASGATAGTAASTANIGVNTGSATSTVTIGSLVGVSTTTIQGGTGNINLVTNSSTAGTVVKTTTNSATAFQIQNSNSMALLAADTTNTVNLLTNPGFDQNATGWSVAGTGASAVRTTTAAQIHSGSGAYAVTLATSGTTTITIGATGIAGGTQAAGNYVFSFWAKGSSAITLGVTATLNGGTCTLNSTAVTATSFQRYSCAVTTTGATTSIAFTSTTLSQTLYIDSAQLESGATLTNYNVGTVYIPGIVRSPVVLQNNADSTNVFTILNAASVSLLSVNSYSGIIQIGSSTTDTTQVNLQLDSFSTYADNGTCSTTQNQGALYYNTNTNAVRACVNAAWEDLVTTGGMGLLLFGVVPDSGNNPGDMIGTGTASVTGPCKVSASTTSVTQINVAACTAYSAGRKIVYPGATLTISGSTINQWVHLCFNSSGVLTQTASGSASANAGLPAFSVSSPLLCLADILISGTVNVPAAIYDVRTFTTTQKEFVTVTGTVPGLGTIAVPSGAHITAAAATAGLAARGVVVAASSTGSTSAPAAIIATSGSAWVKATAGSAGAIVQTGATTAGYAVTAAASATAYANLGYSRNLFPATACTAGVAASPVNCDRSIYTYINIK